MSQWTSDYAIYQDLSHVQGRVPVAVEGSLRACDKPPALNIAEETEVDFFDHCSGDGDVAAAPDYKLIREMLDMVREKNISDDEEEDQSKVVIISKLNPECPVFKPNTNSLGSALPQIKPTKKRQRNIALESILQALTNEEAKPEPIKLLNPNYFILNKSSDKGEEKIKDNEKNLKKDNKEALDSSKPPLAQDVIEKVNGWLETQSVTPVKKPPRKANLEMTNMFKKRTSTESVKKVETPVQSPPLEKESVFVPSEARNEYYQKFLERNKLKQAVKEDIWTKAEQIMKDIDEKRKREAEALPVTSSSSQVSEADTQDCQNVAKELNIPRSEIIGLSQHRHKLTGECIVCKVLTKNN